MPYKEPEKYKEVEGIINKIIAGGMTSARYVGEEVLSPAPRTPEGRPMSREQIKRGQEAIRRGEIKQPRSNRPKTAEQYAKEAAARRAQQAARRKTGDIVAKRVPDYVLKGGRLFVRRLTNPVAAMYSMGIAGESRAGVRRKQDYAARAHEEETGGERTLVGGEKGPGGGYLPMESVPTAAPKRWVYVDPLASEDDPEREWDAEDIQNMLEQIRQKFRVGRFERVRSGEQASQETGQAGRRMV